MQGGHCTDEMAVQMRFTTQFDTIYICVDAIAIDAPLLITSGTKDRSSTITAPTEKPFNPSITISEVWALLKALEVIINSQSRPIVANE